MYIRRAPPWSKKAGVLANIPYTAANPTPGQRAVREAFASAAHAAAGTPYNREENLPGVASYIKHNFGRHYGRASAIETGSRVYPRRVRRY